MSNTRQWGFRYRGAFGWIVLAPAVMLTVFSKPLIQEGTLLDTAIDFLGWGTFVFGVALRVWSTLYLGGRKCKTVVAEGPYSMCRNPLYLGSFFMAASTGFFLGSVGLSAAIALVMAAYVIATVPHEEQKLRDELGADYDAYCQRVPRYWPRPSLFYTGEAIPVLVKGLRLEAKRLAWWIWIPFGCELISSFRTQAWWPHWFQFI